MLGVGVCEKLALIINLDIFQTIQIWPFIFLKQYHLSTHFSQNSRLPILNQSLTHLGKGYKSGDCYEEHTRRLSIDYERVTQMLNTAKNLKDACLRRPLPTQCEVMNCSENSDNLLI